MNFLAKSLLKKQLKGVPDEQIDQLVAVIEKNPEFFKALALKIKEKTDAGMSAEQALQEVMANEGDALKPLLAR